MPRTARQRLGDRAEERAAALLERSGLVIVERNWRCSHGELDIVAREGETLVFVEVRARSDAGWGGARGSITPAKQARLARCALHYLQHLPGATPPCRFDLMMREGSDPHMHWLRDAFAAPAEGA